MAQTWGQSTISTSGLSGYAKSWAEAYNAQVNTGGQVSNAVAHAYATSSNPSQVSSVAKSFSSSSSGGSSPKVSAVDWISEVKKEFSASAVPANTGGQVSYVAPTPTPAQTQAPAQAKTKTENPVVQAVGSNGWEKYVPLGVLGAIFMVILKAVK